MSDARDRIVVILSVGFCVMTFVALTKKERLLLPDGVFIGTNGIAVSIDNGHAWALCSGVTNLKARTIYGTTLAAEFNPIVRKSGK